MKKFSRKALALSLTIVLGTSMLFTGCGSSDKKGNNGSGLSGEYDLKDDTHLGATNLTDTDVSGEVSIMVWSGDGQYHEDIGHTDISVDKITASNVAQVYAVAHKFNEKYPNIKINLWSKEGDPNQPNTPTWEQEMENFKSTYGKYPDVWASDDVPNDVKKGLVADLSEYSDDDTYKAYNERLMSDLNYDGFQAGLPSYTIPAGIWVNKSLAESNNIYVPSPDWTIDEYTDFVTSGDGTEYWGSKSTAASIVDIGTTTINKQLKEQGNVDINSSEVKSLLSYLYDWSQGTVDTANGAGKIPSAVFDEVGGDYSWFFFAKNKTLTDHEDPWYITAAADESASESSNYVNAEKWDIYPYPATDYCSNTIKVIMDPVCVHNYASDDNNKDWSDEEIKKRDIAYAFATYWTASTEAKIAIFDQQWTENGQKKDTTSGDSFPVVTGDAYDEQMKVWNSVPAHKTYEEKEGWQKVLEIWQSGEYWDYSDKALPLTITEKGSTKDCLYEWNNKWNETVAGSWMTDKNWVDNVKSRLADWNTTVNKRLTKAKEQLKKALKDNYNK